jgi:hypothetical protein
MAGIEEQEIAGPRDDTVSAQASADAVVASETALSEQSTPYPRGRDRTECASRLVCASKREASRDRIARSKAESEGQETRRGQRFKDKVEKKRQRMCGENPEDDQEERKSGNTQGCNFTLSKVEVE